MRSLSKGSLASPSVLRRAAHACLITCPPSKEIIKRRGSMRGWSLTTAAGRLIRDCTTARPDGAAERRFDPSRSARSIYRRGAVVASPVVVGFVSLSERPLWSLLQPTPHQHALQCPSRPTNGKRDKMHFLLAPALALGAVEQCMHSTVDCSDTPQCMPMFPWRPKGVTVR